MNQEIINLRKFIKSTNLTLKDFAKKIGVSSSGLSDIINGRTKGISEKVTSQIAKVFSVNTDNMKSNPTIMPQTKKRKIVSKETLAQPKILNTIQSILKAPHVSAKEKDLLVENLNLLTNHLNMTRLEKVRSFLNSI